MDDVAALEAAYDFHDRVDLADVLQEPVPEPFAFRCSFDEAGDVDELDRGRNDPRRP